MTRDELKAVLMAMLLKDAAQPYSLLGLMDGTRPDEERRVFDLCSGWVDKILERVG